MEHKEFSVEIKSIDETGVVKAFLATYRTSPDAQNDIIEPGAFTKSLSSQPKLPMLWQHDTKTPAGHWYKYDTSDSHGVLAEGRFNLKTSWGRDAYGAVSEGDINKTSIGYLTADSSYDKKGVRHLIELDLKEGSWVTFPADDAAVLVSVKENSMQQYETLEAEIKGIIDFETQVKAGKRNSSADQSRVQLVHDMMHTGHEHMKALGADCLPVNDDPTGDSTVPENNENYENMPKSKLIPISAKQLAEAVARAIIGGNPPSTTVKE